MLAYDTSSSPLGTGWGSPRYLFAETDSDEDGDERIARRFVALDFRGNSEAVQQQTSSSRMPGWALGTGYDGNGALGLGQPAELAR